MNFVNCTKNVLEGRSVHFDKMKAKVLMSIYSKRFVQWQFHV